MKKWPEKAENRYMNKLSYGPKKKYDLARKTLVYVKKHGEFNGATPRALRGLLFECHKKTRKKRSFLVIFGVAHPLPEEVGS